VGRDFLGVSVQAWHTDDQTGHSLVADPAVPDRTVRIVAALVNSTGPAPEAERITLLNASPHDVDLAGWSIGDAEKRRMVLDAGSLPAGETIRIVVSPPAQLGNRGGLITLFDPRGLKIDGVAYTKVQAAEGWSVVF
jgi:hypothetical protein